MEIISLVEKSLDAEKFIQKIKEPFTSLIGVAEDVVALEQLPKHWIGQPLVSVGGIHPGIHP